MAWTAPIPYFSEDELKCPGSGILRLDENFAVRLPVLRHEWGRPLIANSVCRSQSYNDQIGGHPRSLHMTRNPHHPTAGSMAADIRWHDWPAEHKCRFARLAWQRGWSIGLNDAFCHIDRRRDIGLHQTVFIYDGQWSMPFDKARVYRK